MNEQLRKFVRDRAKNICEYCHLPQEVAAFAQIQVEHIKAKQHRGNDAPDNLAWACPRCNAYKGPNLSSIDPETQEITLIYNPRLDDWNEHFVQVGIEILGQTAVGRCTVELLHMNDEDRLRVREAMLE
jgi:hypothetical protein